MERKILKEALEYVVHHVPHNTCGKYINMAGESYDESVFGVNCLTSADMVVRKTREYGLGSFRVNSIDGPHSAVFSFVGDELYFSDPSLMHFEPISISELIRTGSPVMSDAYPVVDGKPSIIVLKPSMRSDDEFVASLMIPSGSGYIPKWSHSYPKSPKGESGIKGQNSLISLEQDFPRYSLKHLGDKGSVKVVRMSIGDRAREVFEVSDIGTGETLRTSEFPNLTKVELINSAVALMTTRKELEGFFRKARLSFSTLRETA